MGDDSMVEYLHKYVTIAAVFGGLAIGALHIFADFLGVIGSGPGLLIAVNTIMHMFENASKDKGEKSTYIF